MQGFRKLTVWQRAHALAVDVYAISANLTRNREFWLRDQMVGAAVSVAANIAEGCGRSGDREFRRFVRLALGSASELEYHLLFVRDVGLLADRTYAPLAQRTTEIKRMLSSLERRLSASIAVQDKRLTANS